MDVNWTMVNIDLNLVKAVLVVKDLNWILSASQDPLKGP